MANPTHVHSPREVTDYIKNLDHPLITLIEATRQLILDSDKEIGEHIKWNVPSFFYAGEMPPYNPKEYKRELIVMNFHKKDHLLLVFPSGAKVSHISALLEGEYKDGRRLIKIKDTQDLITKAPTIQAIISAWLQLVEKI